MIQNLSLIPSWTNRLLKCSVLVLLLSVCNTAVWANSGDNYGHLKASTNPASGAGKIYVSTTAVEEGQSPEYKEGTVSYDFSGPSYWGVRIQSPVTWYCYAQDPAEGYLWAGWYDGEGNLLGGGERDISYTETPTGSKDNRTQYELTAKWVQPKVTNGATVDFGTITDMEVDVAPKQVSLGVTDYSKVEHFKVQPNTAGGFTANLLSVTQPVGWAGTATVEVDYTPSGIHGTHTGTAAYLASALYNGDYTSHNYTYDWQAITFTVTEDYTPNYTVVHKTLADAYNMGTTNVGGTLTSADQALKVVDGTKNYAASAPTYSGVGNKQHTTEWTAEIVPCTGKEDYSQYFTIQAGTENTEFPVVVFNAGFTVPENTTQTVYACLELTCTYHDRSAPIVQNITNTETKYIYLSANVEQTNEAKLDIVTNGDADTYHFGTVYIGETPTVTLPLTAMNVTNITSEWKDNTIFEGSVSGNHITLSVKDDISCGTYSSTFKVSATSTLDNTTIKSDEITVKANVQLAAPKVTETGADKAVVFQWNPVPGATRYIIYSNADGNTDVADTTTVCVYTQTVSANVTSVTRWIKAVNDDCESTLTEATAEANLNKITKENAANTGIWTGTESGTGDYEENFPWRTPRPVDVSAAFDEAGNALFDRLYIFALTTGKSTDALSTPCLIYNKEATYGKSYTYSKNEININSASKNAAFTITPTANQKLYFTGYCPYAATGGATDNGVIEIKGGAQTVDLYLDSLQLYARTKAEETIEINAETELQGDAYFTKGSGGVFVLTSSSTDASHPLIVNIHTRGKNTLASQNGSTVSVNVDKSNVNIEDSPKHYSSPIEVLPTSASSAVRLTIDDVWPNAEKNTNGVLVLKEKAADKSNISIGLGNALTQLNLAGGQLKLQSIAATYQTTTYTATKNNVTVDITAYGVCGENNPKGTLNANNQIGLKDGTYNALSGTEVAFYIYTKDLNIDGGTYNAGIEHYTSASSKLTTFYNSDGKELSGFEVSNANLYGTTTDGKYTVTKFAEMVDSFFPDAGVDYQQSGGTTYHSPLSAYYVGGKTYGHSSYAPAGEKLKLWLPKLNCGGAHIAWQICAPDLDAQVSGNTIPLGGSINKVDGCPVHTENKYTVDYLLYMQMDKYTKDALPDYSLRQSSAAEVKLALEGDELYSTIDNTNSYTIQKKVYMLVPIEAAKWTLFAPPFDVANVYVIEAYPEAQLIKDFKGKRGRIPTEYIAAARKAQAQRLLDLYTFWYYEEKALGDAQAYDFFGTGDGYTNGYGKFVNSWINYQNTQNYKVDASGDYNPVIDKLIHFTGKNGTYPDGKNWLYANYYLYEQKGDWTFDNTTNNFTTAWDTVKTPLYGTNSSTDPIMKKGKVYAMEFPFNSLNGVHNPDQTWDYWTGKYLLIESTAGEQTINGSSAITFSDANIASGSAALMGNNTFANVTAAPISNSSTNATFWALEKIDAGTEENTGKRDKHVFQRVDDYATIAPTTGFLLANFKAPANMRARTINYQNGVVTYDTIPGQSEDTPTSIPTIMGQQTLYVQTTQTGLTITPIVPQQVVVYNAAGQMVMNKYITAPEQLALPAGVYVVRGEYENVKAMHNSI